MASNTSLFYSFSILSVFFFIYYIKSDQKAALEHTAQTTADGKLTFLLGINIGINCLFQQLSIVYIRHSKGETETKIYKINADIQNVNKAALAYHFEYQ